MLGGRKGVRNDAFSSAEHGSSVKNASFGIASATVNQNWPNDYGYEYQYAPGGTDNGPLSVEGLFPVISGPPPANKLWRFITGVIS